MSLHLFFSQTHQLFDGQFLQGQTAVRECRILLNITISNTKKYLKLKARLIGQLRLDNLQMYLPNISTKQN